MKNIFIGTGGYYYSGWKPFFYPEDLKSREFLSYYSRFFNFVEINSSYYRPVTRKQLIRMIDQVPQDFLFTVKAHKSITHERLDPDRSTGEFLEESIILGETGHLGGYLLQFPFSFRRTPDNRRYLDRICRLFENQPLFIEFRRSEWIEKKVLFELEERGITPVTTDLPPLKNLPANNGIYKGRNSIYLRFHGRNRELWWTGDSTSRYDYTYTGEELLERLKDTVPMRKSGKLIFAAFNNHYKGQAVKNAMEAKKIFERYPE